MRTIVRVPIYGVKIEESENERRGRRKGEFRVIHPI